MTRDHYIAVQNLIKYSITQKREWDTSYLRTAPTEASSLVIESNPKKTALYNSYSCGERGKIIPENPRR